MKSKKKPRPLFEVPLDIESSRESGWVYRSTGHEQPVRGEEPEPSIAAAGAETLALAMAVVAQALVLGLTIAAIPLTMSLRALNGLVKPRA